MRRTARNASPRPRAPRAERREEELREYHEAPPALVRDLEEWLAVGDRRAAAERVRAWLLESYALGPVAADRAGTGSSGTSRASRTTRTTRARKR